MAKKLVLVDPNMLETRPAKPIPNAVEDEVRELDQRMETVLKRTDLSLRDKLHRYNTIMNDYLHVLDDYKSFKSSPPPPPPPVSKEERWNNLETDVLKSLSAKFKTKGERLLTYLKTSPHIGWTDKGELVVRGESIPGSHMVDLVKDTLVRSTQRKNKPPPPGQRIFRQALVEMNLPRDLQPPTLVSPRSPVLSGSPAAKRKRTSPPQLRWKTY